ncbi:MULTISPECIES: energy transducer TonB [unclassified Psychrobacter]|uniref:energy transducer TonB n=1 Tax=unclassified Psychrobacter TaxID=196806 RepID=UPI003F451B45
MSSTNLDAPSSKLTLTAVAAVIGLHVLTAVALIGMKAPDIKVAPKNQIPPIEIELVTLSQKQPVAAVEEVVPDLPPATPPKPKASPAVKAQPKPRKEPVIKEQKPEVAPPKKVEEKKPDIIKTKTPIAELKVDTQVVEDQRRAKERRQAEEHRRIEQAQQKAEQEARDKAEQEAEKLATEQAVREAEAKAAQQAAAQRAAQAKAAKEAAEAAAQAKAAASNTPVSFTASNADWASAPRLSFPERAARNARSGDTFNVVLVLRVNKQGGIDSVRVAQSSGNPRVDKEAQRQVRSGKFKPFTQNGVPVVGDVTLPVSYAVP